MPVDAAVTAAIQAGIQQYILAHPQPPPAAAADIADQLSVRAVSTRIPKFLSYDVELWAAQCRNAFVVSKVNAQKTMYAHAVATLDPEVTGQIANYIRAQRAGSEFDGLVEELKEIYNKEDAVRWQELCEIRLGEQKPTQLYRQMERLWLNPNTDDDKMLRHWKQAWSLMHSKSCPPVKSTVPSGMYSSCATRAASSRGHSCQ